MAEVTSRRDPVRLNFRDGQIMVTAKDQDIFFISAEKATDACRAAIKNEERVQRFTDEFLLPLARWCQAEALRISACYVVPPESAVLPIYVIGASERYDFDL